MLDEKSKGKEIVIGKAPAPKHGQVIDIMEALKRSMERVPAKKKPAMARSGKEEKESFLGSVTDLLNPTPLLCLSHNKLELAKLTISSTI